MTWAVLLLQDTETLQTYEEYAREYAYETDGEHPPHTLTPPPEGINTKKPNPLARGEPNSHTTANLGPQREPPAWKWTRTPRNKEPLQAHPLTTASRRPRPAATR